MKKLYSTLLFALFATLYLCGCGNIKNPETFSAVEHSAMETTTGSGKLEIHFLDVGQGDSTLIMCEDQSLLIDAGGNDKGTAVQRYLQKQGINKLDYIIGTHADEDHIGGLDVVITKFDCDKIIMPDAYKNTRTYRDVIDAMKYKGIQNTIPEHGATYEFGGGEFSLLQYPEYGDNFNNSSVGIILTYGDNRFLFTGDAEEEAESYIVNSGVDLSCDVYHAGHHGSNTSSSASLLRAAGPEYAVISCGEGNSYGHPRAETLNRFRMMGIKVFRTDEQGTIIAVSDGKEITWDCSPSTTWKSGEPTGGSQTRTKKNHAALSETGASDTRQNNQGYVLNTKTRKFHKPACDGLPSEKNRKDSDLSREEIISQGYVPCKSCNP